MTKDPADFADGICENCGNTGLAGEICSVCGSPMVSIGDVEKFETPLDEDDTYSKDDLSAEPDIVSLEEADEEEEKEL